MNFNSIYFHDSELLKLTYDWGTSTFEVWLKTYIKGSKKPSVSYLLRFLECTYVEIPHHSPWGDSLYINSAEEEVTENGKKYIIEMISGDLIKVHAHSYVLERQ